MYFMYTVRVYYTHVCDIVLSVFYEICLIFIGGLNKYVSSLSMTNNSSRLKFQSLSAVEADIPWNSRAYYKYGSWALRLFSFLL